MSRDPRGTGLGLPPIASWRMRIILPILTLVLALMLTLHYQLVSQALARQEAAEQADDQTLALSFAARLAAEDDEVPSDGNASLTDALDASPAAPAPSPPITASAN